MRRILRGLGYLALWLSVALVGGALGAWWPIRNVSEPWAGDGFGMLIFGIVGLIVGAIAGGYVVLAIMDRCMSK